MCDDVAPQLKNILANAPLYRMLTPRQLDLIAANTSPRRLEVNVSVVSQGEAATGTFWVVYGQVNISVHSKQGSARMLALLGAGKCFGLSEMLLGQEHQACVKTTASSMLLHTERDAILTVLDENPGFAREVMTRLGRQFYSLVRDIGNYSLSAHQRLADYLLRQGEQTPNAEIELIANKSLIASRLCVTPETLSRLFRDFSADGMIKVSGRRITVLDWSKVTALLA